MTDRFERQDRGDVRSLLRLRAREARAERAVHIAALRLESATTRRERVRQLIAEVEQRRSDRRLARQTAVTQTKREAFLRAQALREDTSA